MGRLRHVIPVMALVTVLATALTGCGGGQHSPKASAGTTSTSAPATSAPATTAPATTTSTTAATTTTKATTTTAASTTATRSSSTTSTTKATSTSVAGRSFPAIVNQAMETLQPPASGMEAPNALPSTHLSVSAEATKSLDGSYAVTLIATSSPEPVNSPNLGPSAADPSSDLGTFSTTPVASSGSAASYLQSALTSCAGPKVPVTLTGNAGTSATSCSTAQGPVVSWSTGSWKVVVVDEGGTTVPSSEAAALASWLTSHSLPKASQGAVSVTVPGTPQAGPAITSAVIWYLGDDVYQVSTSGSEMAALYLAASMRPWPGG